MANALAPRRRILLALGFWDHQINWGVAQYAHEAHWILNDMMGHGARVPADFRWDGIITLLTPINPRLTRWISRAKVPVVDLNFEAQDLPFPRVLTDNHAIGRLAAEHLLSRGFRDLGFYQAYDSWVEHERMGGFRDMALERGARFHHIDFSKRRSERFDAIAALAQALGKLPTPVGMMGQFDGTANEIVLACEQAELRVPEEVAVVGVDNDPISSELGLVPLTSVDSDRFLVGYQGAKLLDHIINGGEAPKEPLRIAPKGLIVRRSSDILEIDNASMERALRFIWQHFAEPICVDDVARVAAVSRRKLYYLFERLLGRTIQDEIERMRMEQAKKLLRESDEKIRTVAQKCGWSSGEAMSKVFARHLQLSPTEFRLTRRAGEH